MNPNYQCCHGYMVYMQKLSLTNVREQGGCEERWVSFNNTSSSAYKKGCRLFSAFSGQSHLPLEYQHTIHTCVPSSHHTSAVTVTPGITAGTQQLRWGHFLLHSRDISCQCRLGFLTVSPVEREDGVNVDVPHSCVETLPSPD